ncbi:MAG: InlB B-repeat-containing protein, partial [Tannerella sp.]|nr:InlB B-repeat-containing protein [Tannerella sp.]
MKRLIFTLLGLMMLGIISPLQAQDTEFWFVAPHLDDHNSGAINVKFDRPVFFMITADKYPATVTMEMPAHAGFTTRTLTLAAYESKQIIFGNGVNAAADNEIILISDDIRTGGVVGVKNDRGIHFRANAPVFIYYQVDSQDSKDMFVLKGSKALGTDFYTPFNTQIAPAGSGYTYAYPQFHIVATQNGTTVTIKPTANIVGTNAGATHTVTLNRGETFAGRGVNKSDRPAGTHISATAPIAVTVADDIIGGGDLCGDQIVPTNNLGMSYDLFRGFGGSGTPDYVTVLATQNATTVRRDGGASPVATLNAGHSYEFQLTANTAHITSDKPVYVLQLGGKDEHGGALIPSTFSIQSTRISFYNDGKSYPALFVLVSAGNEGKFTVNGSTTVLKASDFSNVPNLPGWKYTRKDFSGGGLPNGTVNVANSGGVFSLGYFYNPKVGVATSYGYLSAFGDFRFSDRNIYKCAGSSVTLNAGYAVFYDWKLPDGTTKTGASLSSITATQPGEYSLVMNQGGSFDVKDTCFVYDIHYNTSIQRTPTGNVDATVAVSFSAPLTPISGLPLTYAWTFPGATPATSTSATPTVTWYEAGTKTVDLKLTYQSTQGALCDTVLHTQVTVNPHHVNISGGKSATLNGTAGNGTQAAPVTAYRGDSIVYSLTVTNTSLSNTHVTVHDTVPSGLQIGSISDGGILSTGGGVNVISWNNLTAGTNGGTKTVKYTATPAAGSGAAVTVFENKAYFWCDNGGTVLKTSSTWHRAAAFTVSFAATTGGSLTNASSQIIDYRGNPRAGVVVNTLPGYAFNGWTRSAYTDLNGVNVPEATGIADYKTVQVTGNLTLTAVFTPIKYTITCDLNNPSGPFALTPPNPPNPTEYYVTTDTIRLNNPSHGGWTFEGWTGSNGSTPQTIVKIPKGSTGNLSYMANWTLNTYTIQYHYNGGIAPAQSNAASYTSLGIPITVSPDTQHEPTRTGYDFDGWTNDSISGVQPPQKPLTLNASTTGAPGNLSFTAQWTPHTYNITYDYDGPYPAVPPAPPASTPSNPATYTIETPTFTLTDPTKAGYTFVGWTGSNDPQWPHDTVRVKTGTYGHLNYVAHWSFQFPTDTLYTCLAPVLVQSGHDGQSYEWIFPDGTHRTGEDIMAPMSGQYILRTNYGGIVTADTLYVLVFYPAGQQIRHSTLGDIKAKQPQRFSVFLDSHLKQISYRWTFSSDATPATSMSPTPTAVWQTSGRKRATVRVKITDGGLDCEEMLTFDLDLQPAERGLFVDANVSGGRHNGASWTDAYKTIQEALLHANGGDCIWVAGGEYAPDPGTPYIMGRDGVEVYGGFGAWEEYLSERNPNTNPTVLKGSGDAVISTNAVSASARWDGFIIEDGRGDQGAGIRNVHSSVTLANLTVRNNAANSYGGGIYNNAGSPEIYNVEISGNTAGVSGAGIYNLNAHPRLTNVTVAGNRTQGAGGGMGNNVSNPDIRNTIVYDNRATTNPSISNSASTPVVAYSLIQGALPGGAWNGVTGT